ncbi:hypothetical protein J6590_056463 [Homalodisca vitripennis]|nr:hypothetical protein J6590_056463 [Homalodisca vitripennis]
MAYKYNSRAYNDERKSSSGQAGSRDDCNPGHRTGRRARPGVMFSEAVARGAIRHGGRGLRGGGLEDLFRHGFPVALFVTVSAVACWRQCYTDTVDNNRQSVDTPPPQGSRRRVHPHSGPQDYYVLCCALSEQGATTPIINSDKHEWYRHVARGRKATGGDDIVGVISWLPSSCGSPLPPHHILLTAINYGFNRLEDCTDFLPAIVLSSLLC